MNELIRTLVKQAEEYAEVRYDRFRETPVFNECRDTKFAELIVRECVSVVEGGRFLHDQAPTAIFARECSGAIKQHFGVEE